MCSFWGSIHLVTQKFNLPIVGRLGSIIIIVPLVLLFSQALVSSKAGALEQDNLRELSLSNKKLEEIKRPRIA